MQLYRFAAPCLLGLEGLVSEELKAMGAQDVLAENGRVMFSGGKEMLCRANVCCRYAERILLLMGVFPARSFTELFDGVKALPWDQFIGKNDAFPVKGWARQSALYSIPDCQSIIKKAVVERLKSTYRVDWFLETGPVCQIQFSIMKDTAFIMLDTSGDGLHKRGYRRNAAAAPIRETLAAAMCQLARIYPDTALYDPFCGSGTLLIEGALLANQMAPGVHRTFAAERFGWLEESSWRQERSRALECMKRSSDFTAVGSDIDSAVLELTMANAKKAGVGGHIRTVCRDISEFICAGERGLIVTNPPYGERLLDQRAAEKLYRTMGSVFAEKTGWRYGIISPHEEFEKIFGRKADKRRKLYNGMLKCQFYLYFRQR